MTPAEKLVASWESYESPFAARAPLAISSRPCPADNRQDAREMVHDLKNLLTPILGYAQLVLHDLPPDNAQYKRIEKIRRAALSARDLVLHTLSDSFKPPERKAMNLNDHICEFAKTADGMLSDGVRLEWFLEEAVGDVIADPSDIRRVLMNLLANACQAMPDGGALLIRTARVPAPQYPVVADSPVGPPREMVRLSVQDTGCGMEPAVVARIFDSGFTTQAGGSGLGLATVRRIVETYGGWVDVDSVPGAGTAMHVYLPCAAVAQAHAAK
ncbi:MAG: hypothetical protein JW849_02355 [Phycisphaerae bacterium]|nr:hypothetical protein [Phycisphaerae bacterium]